MLAQPRWALWLACSWLQSSSIGRDEPWLDLWKATVARIEGKRVLSSSGQVALLHTQTKALYKMHQWGFIWYWRPPEGILYSKVCDHHRQHLHIFAPCFSHNGTSSIQQYPKHVCESWKFKTQKYGSQLSGAWTDWAFSLLEEVCRSLSGVAWKRLVMSATWEGGGMICQVMTLVIRCYKIKKNDCAFLRDLKGYF